MNKQEMWDRIESIEDEAHPYMIAKNMLDLLDQCEGESEKMVAIAILIAVIRSRQWKHTADTLAEDADSYRRNASLMKCLTLM